MSVVDNQLLEETRRKLSEEQRKRNQIETERSKLYLECKEYQEQIKGLRKQVEDLKKLVSETNSILIAKNTSLQLTSNNNFLDVGLEPDSNLSPPVNKLPSDLMTGYFPPAHSSIKPGTIVPSSISDANHKYIKLEDLKVEGGRILEWMHNQGVLIASSSKKSSQYGITKFSSLDPRHQEFVELHSRDIRDMKCSPFNDTSLLTASLDKTLKIVNTKTNNIVVS